MRQHFLCTQKLNFSWIWQNLKKFPIDPILKITHFGNVTSLDLFLLQGTNETKVRQGQEIMLGHQNLIIRISSMIIQFIQKRFIAEKAKTYLSSFLTQKINLLSNISSSTQKTLTAFEI